MKIANKIIYLMLVMLVVIVTTGCKKKEEKYELYKIVSIVTNEESTLIDEYEYYNITLDYKNSAIQLEYKMKSNENSEIRNGSFTVENDEITITLADEKITARFNGENTIIVNLVVLEFYYKKIN